MTHSALITLHDLLKIARINQHGLRKKQWKHQPMPNANLP